MAAEAIQTFDPSKGDLKGHVYSQLQALKRKQVQPLKISEQQRRLRAEMFRTVDQLTNQLGREPSDEEIAETAGYPVERVAKLRNLMRSGVSQSMYESGFGEDQDLSGRAVTQRTPYDDWVDAVYHDSNDIDKVILQYRTGYRGAAKLPTHEIARRLNLSPGAVSQRAARLQAELDKFYG